MENRFELEGIWVIDNETNMCYRDKSLVDFINKQNAEIKGLQKVNRHLMQQLSNEENSHDLCIDTFNKECEKLRERIKFESDARERFKHSQNQKAIEVLEKVKAYFCEEEIDGDDIKTGDWIITKDAVDVAEYIDNQITELRGKENDNRRN